MTVYLEDFREIVERLQRDDVESTEYRDQLNSVDTLMEEFVTENRYTNILYFQSQFLLDKLVGKDLREWIEWYLYELPMMTDIVNVDHNVTVDDINYHVVDLESFIDLAERGLKLPRKPV